MGRYGSRFLFRSRNAHFGRRSPSGVPIYVLRTWTGSGNRRGILLFSSKCMWVVVPIFGHQVIVLILNFLYRLRPRRDYHCGLCESFQMNWFQFGCPAPTTGILLVLIFPKLVRGCLCGRHSFVVVPGPLVRHRASGPACSWSNGANVRQHSWYF